MEIFKEFSFEAAHQLPNVAAGHKCARLHGHTYRVTVHVTGGVDPVEGWVLDFADMSHAFEPVRSRLDHRFLNDIEGLENPTSEHLAQWIWNQLCSSLAGLSKIVVRETATAGCIYRGQAQ